MPFLSNRTYDVLKFVAQILLPALGTLYFALAGIWDLSNGEQVVGTIMAVDAFMGVLLGLSTSKYNASDERFDGVINVLHDDEGKKTVDMVLNKIEDPHDIVKKDAVLFKVNSENPPADVAND